MTLEKGMALPDLSGLPPWAVVILAVSLAIIFATVWYGRLQGAKSPANNGTRSVELAMAPFDTTAIKHVASAIEALSIQTIEQNRIIREQGRDLTKELAELRSEIRKQGEGLRK
jgi:hypothetical protein